jgi:hypothetical protein
MECPVPKGFLLVSSPCPPLALFVLCVGRRSKTTSDDEARRRVVRGEASEGSCAALERFRKPLQGKDRKRVFTVSFWRRFLS